MAPDILVKDGRARVNEGFETVPDLESFLTANQGDELRIGPDVDLNRIAMRLPMVRTLLVTFPAYADGRGFSIARELRNKYHYRGQLIAEGPLIPDQYVYALQCGYDAVKIDAATYARQNEKDWHEALDAFALTYQRGYIYHNGPAMSVLDARSTSGDKRRDEDPFYGLSAEAALEKALTRYAREIVLASSLGVDSAVLLHMVARIDPSVPIIFLDTGKHFRETLHYRDRLVSELGLTGFKNIIPNRDELRAEDPKGDLYLTEPDACCNLRKVRPIDREIGKYAARITGRKRYQTPGRKNMPILELSGNQAKVNPLAYWQAKDVTAYMRKHDLPPHPLLSLGFLSIGCQPCTTRVAEGEDPRAGRWRDHEKTECGIHFVDGKFVPAGPKTFEAF